MPLPPDFWAEDEAQSVPALSEDDLDQWEREREQESMGLPGGILGGISPKMASFGSLYGASQATMQQMLAAPLVLSPSGHGQSLWPPRGPFGSGKTSVAANILMSMFHNAKEHLEEEKKKAKKKAKELNDTSPTSLISSVVHDSVIVAIDDYTDLRRPEKSPIQKMADALGIPPKFRSWPDPNNPTRTYFDIETPLPTAWGSTNQTVHGVITSPIKSPIKPPLVQVTSIKDREPEGPTPYSWPTPREPHLKRGKKWK